MLPTYYTTAVAFNQWGVLLLRLPIINFPFFPKEFNVITFNFSRRDSYGSIFNFPFSTFLKGIPMEQLLTIH